MKAIVQDRYGSADVLELREVAQPVIGDREVLVRVRAAGVDPGVWHEMTGTPYPIRLAGYGLRRPRKPVRGWDIAGTVETVGPAVTRFRPGDEVFGTCVGGFAEYAAAREDQLALRPENLTVAQAAVVPTSGITALQALRKAGLTAGQHVLVVGAGGGVGTFAVQLAKVRGATVTGVCSTGKADLVRSLGADDVVDYTREDVTAGPRRFDVILDIAGSRPLSRLRRVLAPTGALILVGSETGGRWLGGLERNLAVMALTPFVRQRLSGLLALTKPGDLDELCGLLVAGTVTPVIDRTFPLAEAADAVRYLQHGRTRGGKVALTTG